jgi:UDP-N-acetylglucosamine 4-epimerase
LRPSAWQSAEAALREHPRRWLVSGAAGFIGSHLVERLLELGQEVQGLDNFSTGRRENLEDVQRRVGPESWSRMDLVEGDLCDRELCTELTAGGPLVLHQAALGSVPRSLENPSATFHSNVRAFFNLLDASRRGAVPVMVYASSSSVYGSHPELPRREAHIGEPLSPYAASKRIDEIMASTNHACYGQGLIGLRYFNVFGARQDPAGPYSAVIPRWAQSLLSGSAVRLHGDGSTSRDFCPVECVVQANLLAALAGPAEHGKVFNVALGKSISLLQLFQRMARELCPGGEPAPLRGPFRPGDVLHSQADLTRIRESLGYRPQVSFDASLVKTLGWYRAAHCNTLP